MHWFLFPSEDGCFGEYEPFKVIFLLTCDNFHSARTIEYGVVQGQELWTRKPDYINVAG